MNHTRASTVLYNMLRTGFVLVFTPCIWNYRDMQYIMRSQLNAYKHLSGTFSFKLPESHGLFCILLYPWTTELPQIKERLFVYFPDF